MPYWSPFVLSLNLRTAIEEKDPPGKEKISAQVFRREESLPATLK